MNWLDAHRESERAADLAHEACRRGDAEEAAARFAEAARAEMAALDRLDRTAQPRTFGITAVSAASLLAKAGKAVEAAGLAQCLLAEARLPAFAATQLRDLLEAVRNSSAADGP